MATVADIFKSRQRKKDVTEGKNGETLALTPERSDLVHICKCTSCVFTVERVAAKCFVENCDDTTIKFTERLIAGTLELYNCTNVAIYISPQDALPSVVIDKCSNIDLHFHQPTLLNKIYTIGCKDIVVHLDPPYKKEQTLQFPHDLEDDEQCITSYFQGKLITEKMVRAGGGYPSTAREEAVAEQKAKMMEQYVEKMLEGMISRGPAKRTEKPVEKPSEKPVEKPSEKPAEKPSEKPAEDKPDKETVPTDQQSDEVVKPEEEPPAEAVDRPPSLVTGDALLSAKDKLKPTETVERHIPVVGTEGQGDRDNFNPAISDDEDKKEYFDTPAELNRKLDEIAEWIKNSKHCIMFTGAGISTSAGIPDFRSGMDTVLDTGPGVWEHRAHSDQPVNRKNVVKLVKALPSLTHMGIVKLHEENLVKFTVSQNVDGLHRRSGLGAHELSELHGNTNLEQCKKCKRQYMRDFETREAIGVYDHVTSRKCDDPDCRGALHDSIINFGENLPTEELDKAFINADKADLCIVMGSSLRVTPACEIPRVVSKHGKLVICNLQKTPFYGIADINVHAKCDDVMTGLLQRLNLKVEPFKLKRRVEIKSVKNQSGSVLTVTGVDIKDNTPYSFLLGISVQLDMEEEVLRVAEEPLMLNLPPCDVGTVIPVQLYFHGHYGEPSLIIKHMVNTTFQYLMSYNPQDGKWSYKAART